MHEPSVLDYVKARLKFWEKSSLVIPPAQQEQPPAPEQAAPVETAAPAAILPGGALSQVNVGDAVGDPGGLPLYASPALGAAESAVSETAVSQTPVSQTPAPVEVLAAEAMPAAVPAVSVSIPWLALIPAGLALVAQNFLEPPGQSTAPALIFYLLAAAVALLAFFRGDLRLAARPAAAPQADEMNYRWPEAAIAAPLAVAAFLFFTNNRFTTLNVLLWTASLALFLVAFLQREHLPDLAGGLRRAVQSLRGPRAGWNITISRWALLVLLALAVVLFFRFYQLDTLPNEMVSDHAEKLYDVNDVLNGKYSIFFERNTGREPFQFYWTALVIQVFGLGVSFFALKLGTVLTGLIVLYYTYRLGNLLGGRWVALLALLLVGVSYWANIISRIALRFPLYPLFVAPLLFHLIRGLRHRARNDFIWAGVWLGIGLNGYTSARVVPLLVLMAFGLFFLHQREKTSRLQALAGLLLVVFFSLLLVLPLAHYTVENPQMVFYRSLSRMSETEKALDAPALQILLTNTWRALTMFFYNNGNVWVHSIPMRPAFDVVTAAFFFLGLVLLLARYIKERNWEDGLLLISIPILLLPSTLSLAFPDENPNLNRTAGAYVPAILIACQGMEALIRGAGRRMPSAAGRVVSTLLALGLVFAAVSANYDLFFVQYRQNYDQSAWNTREVGQVVGDFVDLAETADTYYVMGYPYWLDSRQVAIFAGLVDRDPALMPDQISLTVDDPRMKLYIVKPEDTASLDQLRQFYPEGRADLRRSAVEGKDFIVFLVPARQESLP